MLGAPAGALAQASGQGPSGYVLSAGQDPSGASADAARALADADPELRTPGQAVAALPTGAEPRRLAALKQVEQLLSRAQADAAALRETRALAALAEADRIARGLLDLPGMAAWCAEIALRTGLIAAQAGRPGLAHTKLTEAASLDLARRPLAAEAAPGPVAMAEQIWQRVRSAPLARIPLDVQLDAAAHTSDVRDVHRVYVFVDDAPVGEAPMTLELRRGRHLLRVEAVGHLGYGSFIDVLEGPRPAISIVLSPSPAQQALAALSDAAAAVDLGRVTAALGALATAGAPASALLVQARGDRVLKQRCRSTGCDPAVAMAPEGPGPPGLRLGSAAATAFLETPPPLRPAEPAPSDRNGLWVWAGAATATVVTAVVTGVLVSARPSPRRELTVEVNR